MRIICLLLTVHLLMNIISGLNLPGPLVYVVTPSSRTPSKDEGRSAPAPFYYQNWMRRMDTNNDTTTTRMTSTKPPKVKTPDLIFAEFDADNQMQKSIRKLLERERIETPSSTTSKPIYVPESSSTMNRVVNYGLPYPNLKENQEEVNDSDSDYSVGSMDSSYMNEPVPVYLPVTTRKPTTTTTTMTTPAPAPMNVENIWHVIDSEKYNQFSGNWDEVHLNENQNNEQSQSQEPEDVQQKDKDEIDDNFALPGFDQNPGNGAENESRAIRTEPNLRFPYVNLKTIQMKNHKPYFNVEKKQNNMFTNLNNFQDVKNPVRGEAQDVVKPVYQPIDRYNPAQPYLPVYGTKSKQSIGGSSAPTKSVANLIPPPPPPPPPAATDNLQPPVSYDSFPPYSPDTDSPMQAPAPVAPVAPRPAISYQPPAMADSYDSSPPDMDSDGPPMDLGYKYKPPSSPQFVPTLPPLINKPFGGYSYNKPMVSDSAPPTMDAPKYGYHYNKPASPPAEEPDYPDLIFKKPQDGMKGGDDSMGMAPPAPDSDMKPDMDPSDDHGFPHDFPPDFKYHDFDDDHDHYHHHHHHTTTTTTTTTTEMPRVNRYSYYYLGKKLYYLPLYFSVYFIVYVGALIIKAVLRHKIVYPNSWRPNDTTATFFSKRSVDSWDLSSEKLHELTGVVSKAIAKAAEKYMNKKED